MNLNLNLHDNNIAQNNGFSKKTKKRVNPIKLGAKHAARTTVRRTMIDTFGNSIIGRILAMIASDAVNKSIK